MERVETSDGGWVEVITLPSEVTERRVRLVRSYFMGNQKLIKAVTQSNGDISVGSIASSLTEGDFTPEQIMRMEQINDAVISAALGAWSRAEPLPTVEQVLDLPSALVNELRVICAPKVRLILNADVDFKPTVEVDLANPTGRPRRSSGSSSAKAHPRKAPTKRSPKKS